MNRKDILEKYARVRNIEEIFDVIEDKLQKDPEYSEAQQFLQEFNRQETLLDSLEEKIPDIGKKIDHLSNELKSEEEIIRAILC